MSAADGVPVTDPPTSVRLARPEDIPSIVDLIADEEFAKPLTRVQLHELFEGGWISDEGSLGYVVTAGSEIVGVLSTIHAPARLMNGVAVSAVNLSTLFVRPEFRHSAGQGRRLSNELLQAARDAGRLVLGFTAKGPDNVVPRLLHRLGFEELSSSELFCAIGGQRRTLVRPAGRVLSGPEDIRPYLDAERLQIIADHEAHGCGFYVVAEGTRSSFVVTKQRRCRGEHLWPGVPITRVRNRGFRRSDVLHLSDPEVALRSWGRLVLAICWNELTVGLSCAESFFAGIRLPVMTRLPEKIFAYNRHVPPRVIDKLYSELVLLP